MLPREGNEVEMPEPRDALAMNAQYHNPRWTIPNYSYLLAIIGTIKVTRQKK